MSFLADPPPLSTVELQGGPADLPAELRNWPLTQDETKIKVPYYGGYEHFERVDDDAPTVFRWTGRTAVAE